MDAKFIEQQFISARVMEQETGLSKSACAKVFREGSVTATVVGRVFAACPYMLERWQAEQRRRRLKGE